MAVRALLAAARKLPLKYSAYWGAIELAFRARGNGEVEISYDMLAKRLHVCLRTAFRVIERLINEGIIDRYRCRIGPKQFALNTYRFLIPWRVKEPAHLGSSDIASKSASSLDKMSEILPRSEKEERGKSLSLREEIQLQKKMRLLLTEGTAIYQTIDADITRLEGLLHDA